MIEDKKIGLKVATKREALWIKVRDNTKAKIITLEEDLEVTKKVLEIAEDIIQSEQKK